METNCAASVPTTSTSSKKQCDAQNQTPAFRFRQILRARDDLATAKQCRPVAQTGRDW